MKNAVIALTEAVRLARLEIACYRDSDCRSTPEWTINRLAELLGNKFVDNAMAVLEVLQSYRMKKSEHGCRASEAEST